ncbi:related to protein FMP16, mitochondrial [Zygosaccharomyces bailii]|nr:related to protein FMP16, mitochondrial [Zygosaccharomyces bailii]
MPSLSSVYYLPNLRSSKNKHKLDNLLSMLRITSARLSVVSPRMWLLGGRSLSSTAFNEFPHRKAHLSDAEQKEQNIFDANKAKLESMEHDKANKSDAHVQSCDELRKVGEDAQIEQNRPDDGVY